MNLAALHYERLRNAFRPAAVTTSGAPGGIDCPLFELESIAGRGGDRTWQQDDETIEAFQARVEAGAVA